MTLSASRLRQDIYRLLDEALATGKVLEISRKGKILRIVPPKVEGKLSNLKKHDVMTGNPEELVHQDWSGEWKA